MILRSEMKDLLANIAAAAMGVAILWSVVQAWMADLDSKVWATLGALVLGASVALLWRRVSATARPLLVGTAFVLLVGGLALAAGPSATSAYGIGSLSLATLVNLLILASGTVALGGSLRRGALPRPLSIGLGVLGGLLLVPFAYGLASGDSLAELLAGPGLLHLLPVYARPSVLAIVVLLPISVLVLAWDVVAAHRSEDRDPVVALLLLLCALVPLGVGVSALLGTGAPGLAQRTYSAQTWDSLHSQTTSSIVALDWDSPPDGLPTPQFWMEWEGKLEVQQSGQHRFGLFGSGVTGHVYIDGYLITDGVGLSDYLALELGTHRIRVGLIAQAPSGSFALRWTTPGESRFEDIPRALLTHSDSDVEWSRSPRQAAQVGLEWLQSSALRWQRYNGCYGCHVQAQALMGLSIGQDSGYLVNSGVLEELSDFVRKAQAKDGSWHDEEQLAATQFAAMGLAWLGREGGAAADPDLRDALALLLAKQSASGEFPVDMEEVPIAQGSMMTTSNALFALRAASGPGESRYGPAADSAFQWLLQGPQETTQDAAMQLMAIAREAPALPLKTARMRQLLAVQEPGGGWKETPSARGAGAFSTGQVLYALKLAGQPIASPEFGAGVRFLMNHQQVSGQWQAMHTRSARRSDYAPTMWAVIGLAGSYDEATPDVVAPRRDVAVDSGADDPGVLPVSVSVDTAPDDPVLVDTPPDDAVPLDTPPDTAVPLDTPPDTAVPLDTPVDTAVPLDTPPDTAVPLDTPVDTAVPLDTPPDAAVPDEPSGLAIELILPSESTPLSGLRRCEVRLHAAEGAPLQLVGFYLGTERLAEKAVSASSGWSELTTACDFSAVAPGSYTLTAVVQDRSGDRARVQRIVEVVGAEEAP
jgi:hypothetical protein